MTNKARRQCGSSERITFVSRENLSIEPLLTTEPNARSPVKYFFGYAYDRAVLIFRLLRHEPSARKHAENSSCCLVFFIILNEMNDSHSKNLESGTQHGSHNNT